MQSPGVCVTSAILPSMVALKKISVSAFGDMHNESYRPNLSI
jgi:hypothetical protein